MEEELGSSKPKNKPGRRHSKCRTSDSLSQDPVTEECDPPVQVTLHPPWWTGWDSAYHCPGSGMALSATIVKVIQAVFVFPASVCCGLHDWHLNATC